MSGLLRSAVKASVTMSCLILPCAIHAMASSGVVGAIQKKYAVTEVSADHSQVTKDGTTMDLKCAGVYSLPTNDMMSTPPDNTVLDGKIKSPNVMLKYTLEKFGAHVLQTGDKVYITKIESKNDLKSDVLKFTLLTVDALDVSGQDSKKKYSATVSFKFKKGYLDEASPEEVEQAIEAVIAPDSGSDQAQSGNSSQPSGASQPQQQAAAPPAQAPAPPVQAAPAPSSAPPPTISIGESSTQVLQAMGMPQQMIDLGKKKTFVYKNMKIIFVDDKVSDVQ